jgi:hypothetical protein
MEGHLLCVFLSFNASGGSKIVRYFPNPLQPVDAVLANKEYSFPPKKAKQNGDLVCCGPGYYVAIVTDRELDITSLYGTNMDAEEIMPNLKKLAISAGIKILAGYSGTVQYKK